MASIIFDWNVVHIDNKAVARHNILGTNVVVYTAYEIDIPVTGEYHNHTTLQHIDSRHVWYGTITSRMLPRELAEMPIGPEKFALVDAFRYRNEQEAYTLIMEAFPHTLVGDARDGLIEIDDHSLASFVRFGTEFPVD